MKKTIFIFLVLVTSVCYSQEITYFNNIINRIEEELSMVLKEKEYIIYGTSDNIHLFLKREDEFYHFEFIDTKNYDNFYLFIKDVKTIDDSCIKFVFEKSNYIKGKIDSDSDFYKKNPIEILIGEPVYFSYNQNFKTRYCEYFLTTGWKPVPMKQEVYSYLNSFIIGFDYECQGNIR